MGQRGTARVIPAKKAGNTSAVPALQSLLLRGSRFDLLFLIEDKTTGTKLAKPDAKQARILGAPKVSLPSK